MKNVTLIKDYSRLSESNLDLKGGKIIAALTDNADFPATLPSLADFTTVKIRIRPIWWRLPTAIARPLP